MDLKISYRTLRQEVVNILQQMILTGELKPGERISEQEMANRLGVSRGPVREALRQIEQEGLVEYVANKGCFVRQVTGKDILETALLETQLELTVLKLLGGTLTDKTLEKMEAAVDRMSVKGAETTLSDVLEEDNAFHRCILESVPMSRIMKIWEGTGQNSVVLLQRFHEDQERLVKYHKEIHQELLGALRTKDMSVIHKAMMKHCVDVVRLQNGSDEETGFDLDVLLL